MASAGILRRKAVKRVSGKLGRLAVCALVVGSCVGLGGCDQSVETKAAIDKHTGEVQQSLDVATKNVPHPVAYDPLTVSNKVWNGSVALRMRRGVPLPARDEEARGVTLVSAEPMSIEEIAEAISAQTGVPVRLNALTAGGKSSASSSSSFSSASSSSAPVPTPVSGMAGAGGGEDARSSGREVSSSEPSGSRMPISYEGSLSGLLERVSAYFGVSWRYDGSAITISKYETRVFTIEALPGTQEVKEGMQDDQGSGGSSGGGSSGSSSSSASSSPNTLTQNSKFSMDFKYWDELSLVVKSIVGGQGNVVISPSMGTVTATTTPEVMATLSDYLSKENKRMSRQIAINVQIYSVNLGQSEDFNLAFTSFLKTIAGNNSLTSFGGFNVIQTPSLLAPTNTALTSSSLGSLGVAILNGSRNDPTAIFSALSTVGNTSSVAQFPMTTLNNRPVSRRVGKDTSYISTVTNTSTVTTTVPQNTYTPVVSSIHAGFSLQLTPRLLDDGRILLQYSLSLIGLDTLGATNFNTGSGTVPLDLPVTDNRLFVQQSMLRSGQTLIIGGVDQEDLAQNKEGIGSPDNFLLGGGISSNKTHSMMFMAISPQVMDVASDEENN